MKMTIDQKIENLNRVLNETGTSLYDSFGCYPLYIECNKLHRHPTEIIDEVKDVSYKVNEFGIVLGVIIEGENEFSKFIFNIAKCEEEEYGFGYSLTSIPLSMFKPE